MEFGIDDMVFLKIRPYRQTSLRKKRNEKLSPKYFGPFKIIEKLELLATISVYPIFHVSQLKKALGDHAKMNPLVPSVENHEWLTQPEEVYGYRKNLAIEKQKVLISWKGLPPHEVTWEICNDFQQ